MLRSRAAIDAARGWIDARPPDFCDVLVRQVNRPDHRLAELNAELLRVGAHSPAAVPLLLEACRCYLSKNDHPTAYRYATEAFRWARRHDDPERSAAAGILAAVAACWTGDITDASAYVRTTAAVIDRMDDDHLAGQLATVSAMSWVEGHLECAGRADEHLRRGLRLAEARGAVEERSLMLVLRGELLRARGHLAAARDCTRSALELAQQAGCDERRMLALVGLGETALEGGHLTQARDYAEEALRAAPPEGNQAYLAPLLLGLTLIRSGSPREGRDLVLEAAGGRFLLLVPVAARARVHAALVTAEKALNRPAEAWQWSMQAMAAATATGLTRPVGYAYLARAEAIGDDDPDAALRAAAEACAAFERGQAPLARADAQVALGVAHQRRREFAEAVEALGRAESAYRQCGAPLVAQHVRDLCGEAARSAGAAEPEPGLDRLSPRQREVARLIAEGYTNQQIARSLAIRVNTVQVHVGQILRKLQVRSRTEVACLVTLARRSGTPYVLR